MFDHLVSSPLLLAQATTPAPPTGTSVEPRTPTPTPAAPTPTATPATPTAGPTANTAAPTANTTGTATSQPGAGPEPGKANNNAGGFLGGLGGILPIILMFVVLYFILFRGQRKEEKRRKGLINELKKGDRVMTIGGLIARVVSIDGDEVVLKVDESANVKETYRKSAIQEVLVAGEEKK
jgi:preprotein translocase subunit YajC